MQEDQIQQNSIKQQQNLSQDKSLWSPRQENNVDFQGSEDSSEITVMAEIPIKSIGEQKTLIQRIPTTDTIKDLKIRLKSRGIYGNKYNIFIGQTQLFDHQKLIDVYAKAQEKTQEVPLHIVIRFNDIEKMSINTKEGGIIQGQRNQSHFQKFGQRYLENTYKQANGNVNLFGNSQNGFSDTNTYSCSTSSKSKDSNQNGRGRLEALNEINEEFCNQKQQSNEMRRNNHQNSPYQHVKTNNDIYNSLQQQRDVFSEYDCTNDLHKLNNSNSQNSLSQSYCNGGSDFLQNGRFHEFTSFSQDKSHNKKVQEKIGQHFGEQLKDRSFQSLIRLDSKVPPQIIQNGSSTQHNDEKGQLPPLHNNSQKASQNYRRNSGRSLQHAKSTALQRPNYNVEKSPFDRSRSNDPRSGFEAAFLSPSYPPPTDQSLAQRFTVPELDMSQILLHIFVRQKSSKKVKLHMIDDQRYEIHVQGDEGISQDKQSSESLQYQEWDRDDLSQNQSDRPFQNPLSFYAEQELELMPFQGHEDGFTSDLDSSNLAKNTPHEEEGGILIQQNGKIKHSIDKNDYKEISDALDSGIGPDLISEGTGGTYLLRNSHNKPIFVFKPVDEEPNGTGNPKLSSSHSSSNSNNLTHGQYASSLPSTNHEYETTGKKRGVKPGQGAFREVAAYLLDTDNFCNVPQTVFASVRGKQGGVLCKFGSLQKYIANEGSCEQFGYSMFPQDEVHRICILDLRLANADRNAGNILLSKQENGQNKLIPIDHGLCLPNSIEDVYYEWMDWDQSRQKFSDEFKQYIKKLDSQRDLERLHKNGISIGYKAEFILRLSTRLLQLAVELDCSPFQIGLIVMRYANRKAPLEKILNTAIESVSRDLEYRVIHKKFNKVSDHFFKDHYKSLLNSAIPMLEACIKEHQDTTFDDLEEFL